MKNIMVVVTEPELAGDNEYDHAPPARWVFQGTREWVSAFEGSGEIDTHERNWMRKAKAWVCAEAELQSVVDQLTRWHGDCEIRTYKLDTVYYRTVGTIESKAVTKDGVLPF